MEFIQDEKETIDCKFKKKLNNDPLGPVEWNQIWYSDISGWMEMWIYMSNT